LGTPVNTVQRRAGHAKASTTINIYGHTMPGSQENAATKIEELITGVAVKPQSESGASGETPQI
jgi:integrase